MTKASAPKPFQTNKPSRRNMCKLCSKPAKPRNQGLCASCG